MTERWRKSLHALGRLEPDRTDIRERMLRGPRLPEPPPAKGRAVVAGLVSVALAVASFSVLRDAFRGASDDQRVGGSVVPHQICDVPTYDPGVALLGDDLSSVFGAMGPREVAVEVLEAPGEPASSIDGPAAEALRSYLASPQAVNAPTDGWRAISESPAEVIFAAPPDGGFSDWWVTRFTMAGGEWQPRETELVEQHLTAAQVGHGLRLVWSDEVVLADGMWTSSLTLVNTRTKPWAYGEEGYELWGDAHVLDPATGTEVGHVAETVGGWGPAAELTPGASARLPLSVGGALPELGSGRAYDLVACVPELGLASPVGSLRVVENDTLRTVRVLTYPNTGLAMEALGGGTLVVHNGCLAVADAAVDRRPTYVLWPDGHGLISRDGGNPVLIDAVGREVARLGETVTLGGGFVALEHAEPATIGGVPATCRTGGEGYFITSGLASG